MFEWETEEERLLRFMRIPPKKKLQWLYQMHKFFCQTLTKKKRDLYQKLRESR
jgi:hypothetical protein